MALKPITLRLDEEEYEQLKAHLEAFGDPDINVAYVVRAYIRDLNRSLPFMLSSGWDLKNYFGMMGSWLKQFSSMTDADLFKSMANPWAMWGMTAQQPAQSRQPEADKPRSTAAGKKPKKTDA
ncbi:MAG: hypothetical protein FGM62_03440 [Methylobacterium sp.]|nr:hypothetical protein [Methylobacterium sp.]